MLRPLAVALLLLLAVTSVADAGRGSTTMRTSPRGQKFMMAKRVVKKRQPTPSSTAVTSTPKPAASGASPTATTPSATTTPTTTTPTATTPTQPQPSITLPSRTGVELREYSVLPTRNPLAAGPVELSVTNYGEDDHDLTVADASGHVLGTTGDIAPQGAGDLTLTLTPGSYKLFCSLYSGAHDRAGMHETLVVK